MKIINSLVALMLITCLVSCQKNFENSRHEEARNEGTLTFDPQTFHFVNEGTKGVDSNETSELNSFIDSFIQKASNKNKVLTFEYVSPNGVHNIYTRMPSNSTNKSSENDSINLPWDPANPADSSSIEQFSSSFVIDKKDSAVFNYPYNYCAEVISYNFTNYSAPTVSYPYMVNIYHMLSIEGNFTIKMIGTMEQFGAASLSGDSFLTVKYTNNENRYGYKWSCDATVSGIIYPDPTI